MFQHKPTVVHSARGHERARSAGLSRDCGAARGRRVDRPRRELARGLAPSPDPDEVARRQALTAEVVRCSTKPRSRRSTGSGTSARPPRTPRAAERSAPRRSPTSRQRSAAASRPAPRSRRAEPAPLLHELAGARSTRRSRRSRRRSARRVEEDGSDLRDNASPLLRKPARELRDGRQKRHRGAAPARARAGAARAPAGGLRHAARRPPGARREGERARAACEGIVHDASGSGQTLFVEPFEVVELNNRQSEAAGAEREEVERILRELSAAVAAQAAALTALVEATGAIDLPSRAARSRAAGAAPPVERSRTRCGSSARATRCSTRRPRSRSTSISAICARSSSAARTRAARRSPEDARPRRSAPPVGAPPRR